MIGVPLIGGALSGAEGVVVGVIGNAGSGDVVARGVEDGDVGLALDIEVDGGDVAETAEGVAHGGGEHLPDGLLVLELDLGLRGVDVHIDGGGIDIDIEEIGRLHALGNETVVGGDDGLMEIGVAHVTAVDEEEIVTALLTGGLGLAHEAGDAAERRLHLDGQEILRVLTAIDIGYALAQTLGTEVLQLGAVMVEDEMDVGIDEHDALEGLKDIAELGGVGLEELASRGYIIEKVIDLEAAAHGGGGGFLRHDLRGGYLDAGAELVVGHAREQLHLCDGGDGGEGLTTESHRTEGEEVVGLADLRRGMTLEGEAGIGLGHAAAVVDDLNGGAPSIDDDDMDGGRPCVDSILHQLLDHRGRALDHLTSGNLVGYTVGEKGDDVGHFFTFYSL